eukprot:358723-Chlamydomonas_euryale.AAC.7
MHAELETLSESINHAVSERSGGQPYGGRRDGSLTGGGGPWRGHRLGGLTGLSRSSRSAAIHTTHHMRH